MTAPFDIRILPLASQINQRTVAPLHNLALKAEVTFCVRGVISPVLSNEYLHEVLDTWFEHEVKPRLRGRTIEVRYADDAVLVFEHEDDARRVLEVLAKRLGKYGLRLHRDKTRMVDFRSPRKSPRGGSQREHSFAMLGFTHYWGRSRKGRWVVKRKTAKDRFSRALRGRWASGVG